MTQAIVKTDGIDVFALGKVLAASGYFKDTRDEAQAVAKILAGQELGIGPIAALSNIHIVEGKPTLGAHLIAAAIKKSGKYDYRVLRHSDAECVLEFFERGDSVGQSSFSMKDAQRAGLAGRGPWRSYPRNMMFSRALTNGARMYCPDVFVTGVYTPDELDNAYEITPGEVNEPTTDATPGNDLADALENDRALPPAEPINAEHAAPIDAEETRESFTSDPYGNGAPPPRNHGASERPISDKQVKRLNAIAYANQWEASEVKFLLQSMGFADAKDLTRTPYDTICDELLPSIDAHGEIREAMADAIGVSGPRHPHDGGD